MKINDLFNLFRSRKSNDIYPTLTCLQKGIYKFESSVMLRGSEEIDSNYSVDQIRKDAKT